MGGGGAIKTVAKAAGIGIFNGGFRGAPAEDAISSVARKATRQVPALFSSSDEVNLGGLTTSQINIMEAAPTLQEAKEATSELKDALEKVYLASPKSPRLGPSYSTAHESGLSSLLSTEMKGRVISETKTTVSKNALKAFTLLSESPAAQAVVASIACDPNVWGAVLQNEALVEFLHSHTLEKTSESNAEFLYDSSESLQSSGYGNGFVGYLQSMKTTVIEMMSNLSNYFDDLFSTSTPEKLPKDADENDDIAFVDVAKLMGLVVMVIAIIFLKRS